MRFVSFFIPSLVAYIYLSYCMPREDFFSLMLLFVFLFVAYFIYYQKEPHLKWGIAAALLFRVALIASVPNLSDDFYRFYWDGCLWINGISPFEYLPTKVVELQLLPQQLNPELLALLNSPNYYSVYPPINQYIYALGTWLFPHSIYGAIVSMKACLLAFECGSMYLMYQLLKQFELPTKNLLLYALNPLIIIELSANLHFEAVMIFFVLWLVYLLPKRIYLSALTYAAAVCTKLWPLMFAPLFIKRIGWIKTLIYGIISATISILLFATILSWDILQNLFSSIELYFQKFEFNASLYYIIRAIGYQVKGWNVIQVVAPYIALFTFSSILLIAYKEKAKNMFQPMLFAFSIYLALASIVHPWYITPLIAFCIFTPYRYPIIWSALIPLSYYAYTGKESLFLVSIEYILVYAFLLYELRQRSNN